MSLQLLLYWLRLRRDILISEHEIWWSSLGPDRRIERALHKNRRGVAVLLKWADIRTCPTPLHKPYWRHAGGQTYRCSKCEELQPWIEQVAG